MTVREVIDLISHGEWQLIGGRTGKKLCDSYSKKQTKEKYMDMTVCHTPIRADFYVGKDSAKSHMVNYIKPMISIWVSGE